jgi:hypothetical protein
MNYDYQLLQKEIEFLGGVIDKITKERNMYRSQAIMRMNKIQELSDELHEVYKKHSNERA